MCVLCRAGEHYEAGLVGSLREALPWSQVNLSGAYIRATWLAGFRSLQVAEQGAACLPFPLARGHPGSGTNRMQPQPLHLVSQGTCVL